MAKAEIFVCRFDKYGDSKEPWGSFVAGRSYACGMMLQGKVIFRCNGRSSVLDSLRDSASDICGHMVRHGCSEYELKNGFIIDGNDRPVACERLSSEEEQVFLKTLDERVKENLAFRQHERGKNVRG